MGEAWARLTRGLGRNLGAWLGGAALVLLLVILGVRRRMAVVAEEQAQIAADEHAVAERLERERAEADAQAKKNAVETAAWVKDRQRRDAEIKAAELAAAGALTPAQREKALREKCAGYCDDSDPLIAAAPPAERQRLRAIAGQIRENAAADKRKAFAIAYEHVLLERRMNPDSVKATGPKASTLSIRGWFCTKQFMYDLMKGDTPSVAREMGFAKVECDSALGGYEQEL